MAQGARGVQLEAVVEVTQDELAETRADRPTDRQALIGGKGVIASHRRAVRALKSYYCYPPITTATMATTAAAASPPTAAAVVLLLHADSSPCGGAAGGH